MEFLLTPGLVALDLDRIKTYGFGCSGQTVYTDARAYVVHVLFAMADSLY